MQTGQNANWTKHIGTKHTQKKFQYADVTKCKCAKMQMGQNISLHRIFKKKNIVRLARPSLALALGLACQKTAVFHAALQNP